MILPWLTITSISLQKPSQAPGVAKPKFIRRKTLKEGSAAEEVEGFLCYILYVPTVCYILYVPTVLYMIKLNHVLKSACYTSWSHL